MDNLLLKEFMKNEEQFLKLVNSALKESKTILERMEKGEDIDKASEYERFKNYVTGIQNFDVGRKKTEMEYFEQITSSASNQEKLDMLYECLARELGAYEGFETKRDLTHSLNYLTHALSFFLSVLISNSREQREKVVDVYLKAIEGANLPFNVDKEEIIDIINRHTENFEMTTIATKTPGKSYFPLDRITEELFSTGITIQKGETPGTIDLTPNDDKDKRPVEIELVLCDSIGDLELTVLQKRILSSVGTLFVSAQEQGKERCVCTLRQVMDLMGYRSQPNKNQEKKIIEEMEKLTLIRYVRHKSNFRGLEVDIRENMLSISMAIFMTNKGKLVECPLHILDIPPVFKDSRSIGQIERIPKNILKLPLGINMTDDNLKLHDFLVKKVLRLNKNPNSPSVSPNLEYEKLKEFTTPSLRLPKVIENTHKILDNFQELRFIKGYDKKNNGLHINILPKKERNQIFLDN